jgi:hypothetical protein
MSFDQLCGISYANGAKKMDFSIKRVMLLTLVFTDVYFVSLFFAKLFRWV